MIVCTYISMIFTIVCSGFLIALSMDEGTDNRDNCIILMLGIFGIIISILGIVAIS